MSDFFIDPESGEAFITPDEPVSVQPDSTSWLGKFFGGLQTQILEPTLSFAGGMIQTASPYAEAYNRAVGEPTVDSAREPQEYDMGWYPSIPPQDTRTGIPVSRPTVIGLPSGAQGATIGTGVLIIGGLMIYALVSGRVR